MEDIVTKIEMLKTKYQMLDMDAYKKSIKNNPIMRVYHKGTLDAYDKIVRDLSDLVGGQNE